MVASGASLYEENKNGETACDCAIKGNFNDIASFLESRMVFSVSIDHVSKLKKSSTDATCTWLYQMKLGKNNLILTEKWKSCFNP